MACGGQQLLEQLQELERTQERKGSCRKLIGTAARVLAVRVKFGERVEFAVLLVQLAVGGDAEYLRWLSVWQVGLVQRSVSRGGRRRRQQTAINKG